MCSKSEQENGPIRLQPKTLANWKKSKLSHASPVPHKTDQPMKLFTYSLMAAIIAGIINRGYYAFVFLPGYRDGARATVMEWQGWWAYVRSPMGNCLNLVFLGSLLLVVGSLILARRSKE